MRDQIEVTIGNDLSEIHRLSDVVSVFGEQHGLPKKVSFALDLAFDELLTNIISYGYADRGAHDIYVRLYYGDGVVTAEIEDDAVAFDPLDLPDPDIEADVEDRAIGGLGIYFVKKVMDEVSYRREGGRNRLVMKKKV